MLPSWSCLKYAHKLVAAVIKREHQCSGLDWPDSRVNAGKIGWKLAASLAGTTERRGRSAGTAIATRSALQGRLSAVWARIAPPIGIAILSAYLWHSEVLTLRNRNLVLRAMAVAKSFGCPWILGADFQIPLEEL